MAKYEALHYRPEKGGVGPIESIQKRGELDAILNMPKAELFQQVAKIDKVESFIEIPASARSLTVENLNQLVVDSIVKFRNHYDFKKLGKKGNNYLKTIMVQAIEKLAEEKKVIIEYKQPEALAKLFKRLKIENKIKFQLKRNVPNKKGQKNEVNEWTKKGVEIFERELKKKHFIKMNALMADEIQKLCRPMVEEYFGVQNQPEVIQSNLSLSEIEDHLEVLNRGYENSTENTDTEKLSEAISLVSRVRDLLKGDVPKNGEVDFLIRRFEVLGPFPLGNKCIDYLQSLKKEGVEIKVMADGQSKETLVNPENEEVIEQMEAMAEAIEQSGDPEASEAAGLLRSQIEEIKINPEKVELPGADELMEIAEEFSDKKLKTDHNILQILRASAIASPVMLVMVFLMFIMGNLKTKSGSLTQSSKPGVSHIYLPGADIDGHQAPGGSGEVDNPHHPAEDMVQHQDKKIESLKFSRKQIKQQLKTEKKKSARGQKQLKKAGESIKNLERRLNDGEANAKAMEEQIKEKEAVNLRLKQDLQSEKADKEKAQQKVTVLEGKKTKTEKELRNLEQKKQQVDHQLKNAQQALDSEKRMNQKKRHKLERKLKKLSEEKANLEKRQQKLVSENQRLQGDLNAAMQELQGAQKENIDLNHQNKTLVKKLAAEKELRKAAEKEAANYRAKAENEADKSKKLAKKLKKTSKDFNAYKMRNPEFNKKDWAGSLGGH